MTRASRGTTLVELLVVLTILGIIAALVAPAIRMPVTSERESVSTTIARARQGALRNGHAVTVLVPVDDTTVLVTALADGSVLAGPGLDVDRATGRLRAPR